MESLLVLLRSVLVVATMSILAFAQDPAVDDLAERVAALVRQLDADQFATRNAAERELIQLGPAVLAHLPDPDQATSLQVRMSLEGLRRQLLNQRAMSALKAAQVSLSGKLTVDQLADRLEKQTGNPVSVALLSPAVRGRSVEVDYSEVDFWPAIDDLAARLAATASLSEGSVVLKPRGDQQPLVSYSGPFRVQQHPVRIRPLAGRDTARLLRIPLRLGIEPRLRGLFLKAPGAAVTVASETGREFPPFSPDQRLELPFGGRGESVAWNHDVVLPPDQSVEALTISGSIQVLMAVGYERFEFPQLANAKRTRQRRTGVFLFLDDVELDEEQGDVTITLTVNWLRSIGAFDSYRTWQFHNEAWLQTPDGSRVNFSGPLRTDGQAGGAVRLTYRFTGVTAPLKECRFVYEAPTALQTVTVPFRFECRNKDRAAP